jgi:hypothetical protein
MTEPPTELFSIVFLMANSHAMLHSKEDDDADSKITDDDCEEQGMSTLPSDIEQDELAYTQEVLHLRQPNHYNQVKTTSVLPSMN